MTPLGRHKRPDARMEAIRKRAETVARHRFPNADRYRAFPYADDILVEVWEKGRARAFRYTQ